jgi:hypothetical protein
MSGPAPTVQVGDVLYLHDVRDTQFSRKQRMRWWIVVAVNGNIVRVAPRSASSRRGISVPATAMTEFTLNGRVPKIGKPISMAVASGARNIGQLPEPYLSQVLAQARRRRSPPAKGSSS